MEKGFLSWLGSRADWTELTWRKVSSAELGTRTDWTEFTWRKVSSAGLGSQTDWTELTWRKVSSAGSVAEQTGLSLHGERFPQLAR